MGIVEYRNISEREQMNILWDDSVFQFDYFGDDGCTHEIYTLNGFLVELILDLRNDEILNKKIMEINSFC
ncbi:MAG: hypothetical protein AAF039_15065 [Bacteroidota bacterium]